jgi:hypothetical protein
MHKYITSHFPDLIPALQYKEAGLHYFYGPKADPVAV